MYSLSEILSQACDAKGTTVMIDPYLFSVITNCCKITEDNLGKISIFAIGSSGEYYNPCTKSQMHYFYSGGWNEGVYNLQVEVHAQKLKAIDEKIKVEREGKNRYVKIETLYRSRQSIVDSYQKVITNF